ncbi:hypothetical protein BD626DRAFT_636067 [Schizophyllum amplum]|uniref:Uncharacterized protein n=1 Tax=Schizophyllum amplum TaxID=97359 RepID=A0A550BU95_9AGAR|nr:hypothetical protein BD626DRAFT_636067 [Auriculariopsis ampla]
MTRILAHRPVRPSRLRQALKAHGSSWKIIVSSDCGNDSRTTNEAPTGSAHVSQTSPSDAQTAADTNFAVASSSAVPPADATAIPGAPRVRETPKEREQRKLKEVNEAKAAHASPTVLFHTSEFPTFEADRNLALRPYDRNDDTAYHMQYKRFEFACTAEYRDYLSRKASYLRQEARQRQERHRISLEEKATGRLIIPQPRERNWKKAPSFRHRLLQDRYRTAVNKHYLNHRLKLSRRIYEAQKKQQAARHKKAAARYRAEMEARRRAGPDVVQIQPVLQPRPKEEAITTRWQWERKKALMKAEADAPRAKRVATKQEQLKAPPKQYQPAVPKEQRMPLNSRPRRACASG